MQFGISEPGTQIEINCAKASSESLTGRNRTVCVFLLFPLPLGDWGLGGISADLSLIALDVNVNQGRLHHRAHSEHGEFGLILVLRGLCETNQ